MVWPRIAALCDESRKADQLNPENAAECGIARRCDWSGVRIERKDLKELQECLHLTNWYVRAARRRITRRPARLCRLVRRSAAFAPAYTRRHRKSRTRHFAR